MLNVTWRRPVAVVLWGRKGGSQVRECKERRCPHTEEDEVGGQLSLMCVV